MQLNTKEERAYSATFAHVSECGPETTVSSLIMVIVFFLVNGTPHKVDTPAAAAVAHNKMIVYSEQVDVITCAHKPGV